MRARAIAPGAGLAMLAGACGGRSPTAPTETLSQRIVTDHSSSPSLSVLHTIWPTDNHQVVPVYTAAWGFPVALFVEGLLDGGS
jgi:hypothetical protein